MLAVDSVGGATERSSHEQSRRGSGLHGNLEPSRIVIPSENVKRKCTLRLLRLMYVDGKRDVEENKIYGFEQEREYDNRAWGRGLIVI